MIRFACPKCRQVMQADDRHTGQVFACPACKTAVRSPGAAPVSAAPTTPLPPEATRLGPFVRELQAKQDLTHSYWLVLGGGGAVTFFLLCSFVSLAMGELGIFCILFTFVLVPASIAAYGVYCLRHAGQTRAFVCRDGFVCVTPRETIVLAWNEVAQVRQEIHRAFRLGAPVSEVDRFEIRCRDGREVVLSESMPLSGELGRLVQQYSDIRPM